MSSQTDNDNRMFELRKLCSLALRKTGAPNKAVEFLDGTGMEYRMFCRHTKGIRKEILNQGPLSEEEEKILGELMFKYQNGKAKTPRRRMNLRMVIPKSTIRWFIG